MLKKKTPNPPKKTTYVYNTNKTLKVARRNVRVDLLEEYAK